MNGLAIILLVLATFMCDAPISTIALVVLILGLLGIVHFALSGGMFILLLVLLIILS